MHKLIRRLTTTAAIVSGFALVSPAHADLATIDFEPAGLTGMTMPFFCWNSDSFA